MAVESGSDNPLDHLRLSLMQEVLPVGLAVVERARHGGPSKVVEAFTTGSADPLDDLRQEGEPAARTLRDQLDALSPGLGNPVMPVVVAVEEPQDKREELLVTLQRIDRRLTALKAQLKAD